MATRKSSTAAAARRAAQERAVRFQEREQTLLNLAVDYATADGELAAIGERYDQEVAKLRADQERDEQAARLKLARAAASMVELGVSKDETAERLGITRAALNEALRTARAATKTSATDEPADDQTSDELPPVA